LGCLATVFLVVACSSSTVNRRDTGPTPADVAGQHILGIFDIEGGRIVPVQVRGQGRLEFVTGGALSFGQGAGCTMANGRPALYLYRVRKSTTERWSIRTAHYLWDGDRLVPGKVSYESRPVKPVAFDPSIAHLFELRCGSVEFM